MPIEAVLFDVFGTVVDWRTSLIRRFERFGREQGLQTDWASLVDDWRAQYEPAMRAVRSGERPWTNLEQLHRESLEKLLSQRVLGLTESQKRELLLGWHFLDPWPDTLNGLGRLKAKYLIGTLSNGGQRLLADMAKFAGLPWDVVFSADIFRHYKPDREVYEGAIELLDTRPENVVLVAAHNYDLAAARQNGLKTAFVARPTEYGARQSRDFKAESDWDFIANDFEELASLMGA